MHPRFILSLMFLGKIERTVFLDKKTLLHLSVSKSKRTPESSSCTVRRRGDPSQAFFRDAGGVLYLCAVPSLWLLGVQDKLWGNIWHFTETFQTSISGCSFSWCCCYNIRCCSLPRTLGKIDNKFFVMSIHRISCLEACLAVWVSSWTSQQSVKLSRCKS